MLSKKYLAITITTAILLAISVAGYLTPPGKAEIPTRILFDSNGGKIVFSHLKHIDEYGEDCIRCHHKEEGAATPLPCGTCHARKFDQNFAEMHMDSFAEDYCSKCHHPAPANLIFDHELHEDPTDGDCQACHHGPDIEPEPQACSDCHGQTHSEDMPGLRQAGHARCADCHQDILDDPKACSTCHARGQEKTEEYIGCGTCHETETKNLIPPRTGAYHDKCMGCHEENGSGPYKEEECGKCHMR